MFQAKKEFATEDTEGNGTYLSLLKEKYLPRDTENTEIYIDLYMAVSVFSAPRQLLLHCSTTAIHGGVPPVTHMDVVTAKAMLEHRWPSVQSSVASSLP